MSLLDKKEKLNSAGNIQQTLTEVFNIPNCNKENYVLIKLFFVCRVPRLTILFCNYFCRAKLPHIFRKIQERTILFTNRAVDQQFAQLS